MEMEMEAQSAGSILECQICFNFYSPRRRPKLLACRHTCCSVCLAQMRCGQDQVRCPWCRGVTRLPAGRSVTQLPDDPNVIGVITVPRGPHHTPVFIRLPSNGCHALPVPVTKVLPGDPGLQQKGMAVVVLPEGDGVGEGEREGRGARRRGAVWSGVCTIMLAACLLLFLLVIILHNMSCISKRFAVISCG